MHYIFRTIRFIFWSRTTFILVLAVLLLVSLLFVYGWLFQGGGSSKLFAEYLDASEREMVVTLIPGVDSNPLRQELNLTLREVLADGLLADERLSRANRGIELLNQSEKQIDAIGNIHDEVERARLAYEGGSLAGSFYSFVGAKGDLATLLQKRSEIASDIRGLSYRANFHTEEIFKRIISDSGKLTEAHILSLNDLIPKVEEQFNDRSNLYREMDRVSNQIESLTAEL